jgi:hypothetical protein
MTMHNDREYRIDLKRSGFSQNFNNIFYSLLQKKYENVTMCELIFTDMCFIPRMS